MSCSVGLSFELGFVDQGAQAATSVQYQKVFLESVYGEAHPSQSVDHVSTEPDLLVRALGGRAEVGSSLSANCASIRCHVISWVMKRKAGAV